MVRSFLVNVSFITYFLPYCETKTVLYVSKWLPNAKRIPTNSAVEIFISCFSYYSYCCCSHQHFWHLRKPKNKKKKERKNSDKRFGLKNKCIVRGRIIVGKKRQEGKTDDKMRKDWGRSFLKYDDEQTRKEIEKQ